MAPATINSLADVRACFDALHAPQESGGDTGADPSAASPARFIASLNVPSYDSVPLLNGASGAAPESWRPEQGALVRYRGMVQATLPPQFIKFTLTDAAGRRRCGFGVDGDEITGAEHDGYFADVALPSTAAEQELCRSGLGERHQVVMVDVPAETAWARQRLYGRAHGCDGAGSNGGANVPSVCAPSAWRSSAPAPLSYLVKFYADDNDCAINDIVEVLGIVSYGRGGDDGGDEGAAEGEQPPCVARAPRIHVLRHRCLLRHGTHSSKGGDDDDAAVNPALCASARDEFARSDAALRPLAVHEWLRPALQGDALAANYVLLALLASTVGAGADGGQPQRRLVGKLAVQLSLPVTAPRDEARDAGRRVAAAIDALVPRCAYLPLSVAALNRASLVPRMDYDANCLVAGALQLARGTVLVIDETAMDEGQLNETGVANLRALGELARDQVVQYVFPYTQGVRFEVDLPVIVISCGRGLLHDACDVRVPMPARAAHDEANGHAQPEEAADRVRAAVARMRADAFPRIEDDLARRIEREFVDNRRHRQPQEQEREQTQGSDSLHTPEALERCLNLARMAGRAHAEPSLTWQRWQWLRALEADRLARCDT